MFLPRNHQRTPVFLTGSKEEAHQHPCLEPLVGDSNNLLPQNDSYVYVRCYAGSISLSFQPILLIARRQALVRSSSLLRKTAPRASSVGRLPPTLTPFFLPAPTVRERAVSSDRTTTVTEQGGGGTDDRYGCYDLKSVFSRYVYSSGSLVARDNGGKMWGRGQRRRRGEILCSGSQS